MAVDEELAIRLEVFIFSDQVFILPYDTFGRHMESSWRYLLGQALFELGHYKQRCL